MKTAANAIVVKVIERFDAQGRPHGESVPAYEVVNVKTGETVAAVWRLHGVLHRRDGLAIVLPPEGSEYVIEGDPHQESVRVEMLEPEASKAWWRGNAIPESWVTGRPTMAEIKKQENADLRAAAIDLYGLRQYIKDVGAKCLDSDLGEREAARELYEVPGLPHKVLIATDGSSGRIYEIAVPMECRTCAEAGEALNGGPDEDVIAES